MYVYYTAPPAGGVPSHNRVSRFTASASDPDVAEAGSERVIFDIPGPSAGAHNAGALHFGTDGKLYVAVGDHSVSSNGQKLTTVKGKILRLNPDGTIPPDNPFFTSLTGINRAIWAYGLRNPFRTAIQRTTGRIFINDVGNGSWEEINDGVAGANYGWSTIEGPTDNPSFQSPLFAYPHQSDAGTTGCAIVGGAFYNPVTARFPSQYVGKYFFTDYCQTWLRVLDPATRTATIFATGVEAAVDLQIGNDGALYYLQRNKGQLKRITFAQTAVAPTITDQPADLTLAVGATATFSVSAEGTPPFAYKWFRNGALIAGATSPSYSFVVSEAHNGRTYRATVSNVNGTATSRDALLTVFDDSELPTVTIVTSATRYSAGDTLTYSGSARDGDGNPLPPSALTWRVDFHHDAHTHPVVLSQVGSGGSFTVSPDEHREASNVWFRFHLTAKAPNGLETTDFADVTPNLATLMFKTEPTGLQVRVNGPAITAPAAVESVVGIHHALDVARFQAVADQAYAFDAWTHGGPAAQTVTTPAAGATYTARFEATPGLTAYEDDFSSADFGAPWVTVIGDFAIVNGELWSSAEIKRTFQTAIIPTFVGANMIVRADFVAGRREDAEARRIGASAGRVELLQLLSHLWRDISRAHREGYKRHRNDSRVRSGPECAAQYVLFDRSQARRECPHALR